MGKRVKPKNLIDGSESTDLLQNAAANDAAKASSTSSNEEASSLNVADSIDEVNDSLIGYGRLTAEAKDKLERYDALENNAKALANEKLALDEKLAEYVELVDKLKAENAELKKSEASNSSGHIKELEAKVSSLEKSNRELREEADDYLVKISELTFENAKLTSQMNEMKSTASAKQSIGRPNSDMLKIPNRDPYNPYFNNGYGSW